MAYFGTVLPIYHLFAIADSVIVGELLDVVAGTSNNKADKASGEEAVEWLATVKIHERLRGADQLTHLHVVFAGDDFRNYQHLLGPNQEACFFLRKRIDCAEYMPLNTQEAIVGYDEHGRLAYDVEMGWIRRCSFMMRDPEATLKVKESADRLLTANMLLIAARECKIWKWGVAH